MWGNRLQKKQSENALCRKLQRNKLFQRNRCYLERQALIQRTQNIDPLLGYQSVSPKPNYIHSQFSTIIDTFPLSAFQLQQLPKLIRILDTGLLVQQSRSLIGIDFLAQFFKDNQIRSQALSQNLIEKLFSLLKQPCSLLTFKALSVLRKLINSMSDQQQLQTFASWRKIKFMTLLELLQSKYAEIRKQSLLLIDSLVERNFQFQTIIHKSKLFDKLTLLTQSDLKQRPADEFQAVFCLIQKIGLNFGNPQFNQIQIVCHIKLKLLQQLRNTQIYDYALTRTSKAVSGPKLIKQFNQILSSKSFSEFQSLYPNFTILLQLLFLKEVLINQWIVTLFEEIQLSKLLSHQHIYSFFVHLRILPKIRFSLLTESLTHHSENWSVAISCLTLIERLFQKNYKSFVDWLAKDVQFFIKLEQLYTVKHEYLHKQLNSTLNQMIKANPHYLSNRLKQHTLIQLYFQSLNQYGRNTVKVAISSLKKSLQSLRKNPFSMQNQGLSALIKQEAKVLLLKQKQKTKGRWKSQVNHMVTQFLSGQAFEQ